MGRMPSNANSSTKITVEKEVSICEEGEALAMISTRLRIGVDDCTLAHSRKAKYYAVIQVNRLLPVDPVHLRRLSGTA